MSRMSSALERPVTKPVTIMNRHDLYGANLLTDEARELGGPIIDAQTAKYGELLDGLTAALRTVATNPSLSPVGKTNRRQELRAEVARTMAVMDKNQLDEVARQVKSARDGVEAVPHPAKVKDVLEFLVHQEIRSDLKAMTQLDREALVKVEALKGNTELVRAVVHAPSHRPLVTDSVKTEVIETWKRTINPAAFDKLDAAVEVEKTFQNNRAIASRNLGKLVGGDPIVEQAGPDPVEEGV